MASLPKQPHLDEDPAEDPNTKKIGEIQIEIDRLNEKASSEILEVEQRYNKLRKPLFDQRSKLIAAIPNFWSTVFKNHKSLHSFLSSDDYEVMRYLKNIEVQEFDDIKSGYRIIFTFESNPYFSNTTLEKEFRVQDSGEPSISCTEIKWYPGKNFTANGDAEAGSKREPDCFFTWLTDDNDYGGDEIGDVIKDDLWVSPMAYYLQEYAYDDEDDECLDNEDDDEEFDNEDDDEEEDDDGEGEDDEDSKDQ